MSQTFHSLSVDLVGAHSGKVKWVDLDNDKDLDLLYNGFIDLGANQFETFVYENVDGNFVQRSTALPSIRNGAAVTGDFDNDGDYDVFITGLGQFGNVSELYQNNGDFTFVLKQSFPKLINSNAAWFDMENDGDLDLILCGTDDDTGTEEPFINYTFVYENIGNTFTLLSNTGIASSSQSSLQWVDRNGDGKTDLLMTGYNQSVGGITRLYLNNGNKTFREDTSVHFENIFNGDGRWGDFDNDGDMDILFCGSADRGDYVYTGVYENSGSGFVKRTDIDLFQIGGGFWFGSTNWVDLDNDGFLDIVVSGLGTVYLYRNNKHGNVEALAGSQFAKVTNTSLDFGDFDNDGDIDIAYVGHSSETGAPMTGIYENTLFTIAKNSNTQPLPPSVSTLSESFYRTEVKLHWSDGSDTETPAPGLAYNFYLRSATQKFATPTVDMATGFIRTENAVNAGNKKGWVNIAAEGQFFWGVQSMDGGKLGSFFSAEKSFYKFNGPTAINAEIIDPTHVKLSWIDNSTLEQNYIISRSLDPVSGHTILSTLNKNITSYIDAFSFLTDTYYYYRIYARNATNSSSYDSLQVLIPTPPAKLEAITAWADSISLRWEDRSSYETGYIIERNIEGEGIFHDIIELPAGSVDYRDLAVEEGIAYIYRVRAINQYGSSAYSNTIKVQTNFRPVGIKIKESLLEDDTLFFQKVDFLNSFSDQNITDTLNHIVVKSLPQTGVLYLNGTAVKQGEKIQVNLLNGIMFVPDANMNGTEQFQYLINDGRDNSLLPVTVSMIVTPVNDPPVMSTFPDVVAQQYTVIPIVGFTVSDIDDPISSLTISAVSSDTLLIKNKNIIFSTNTFWFMKLEPDTNKAGNTSITIQLTDGKDTVSRQCNVMITPVTGIEDAEAIVQVYPNPVASELNVAVSSVYSVQAVAVLTDMSGCEIKRLPLSSSNIVGMHDLAPGVYLLTILRDNLLLNQIKIVKY